MKRYHVAAMATCHVTSTERCHVTAMERCLVVQSCHITVVKRFHFTAMERCRYCRGKVACYCETGNTRFVTATERCNVTARLDTRYVTAMVRCYVTARLETRYVTATKRCNVTARLEERYVTTTERCHATARLGTRYVTALESCHATAMNSNVEPGYLRSSPSDHRSSLYVAKQRTVRLGQLTVTGLVSKLRSCTCIQTRTTNRSVHRSEISGRPWEREI